MSQNKGASVQWAQVGATIFLGVVGLAFTTVQNAQQNQDRKMQDYNRMALTATQLMSQREQSETQFRQEMFQSVIDKLFNQLVPVRERVTVFEVFQHNFHDIFNARAFYDLLERDARKLCPRGCAEQDSIIHDLVSLAREVSEAQELLVATTPQVIRLAVGDSVMVHVFEGNSILGEEQGHEGEEGVNGQEQKGVHEILVKLTEVREHDVKVSIDIDPENALFGEREFRVSYFDAPLTDNTLLPDGHRIAIVLRQIHGRRATLSVLEFRADYVPTGYRPAIKGTHELIALSSSSH